MTALLALLLPAFAQDDPEAEDAPPPPPPTTVVRGTEPDDDPDEDDPAPTAGPAGDAPVGAQTPCEWLVAHRDQGTSLPRQIELAQDHQDLFTWADKRCVRQAGFHKRVLQALRRPTPEELDARKAAREADSLADRFDVTFVGVVVGPTTAAGTPWDGDAEVTVPDGVRDALEAKAGTSGVLPAGAIDEVVAQAHEALQDEASAPELFGWVEYRGPSVPMHWVGGRLSLRAADDVAADTLYADFPGAPTLRGIRVRDSDVLRVHLHDRDPDGDHDAVTPVDLSRHDLDTLAFQGGAGGVWLAGRTDGEVWVLLVSAARSQTPSPAAKGRFYQPG